MDKQQPWYYLRGKDFIPIYGISNYEKRIPKGEGLSDRNFFNYHIIVLGQLIIGTGMWKGLEALLK